MYVKMTKSELAHRLENARLGYCSMHDTLGELLEAYCDKLKAIDPDISQLDPEVMASILLEDIAEDILDE